MGQYEKQQLRLAPADVAPEQRLAREHEHRFVSQVLLIGPQVWSHRVLIVVIVVGRRVHKNTKFKK